MKKATKKKDIDIIWESMKNDRFRFVRDKRLRIKKIEIW